MLVVGLLLQAFALQAAPLLGPTTITTANATFYATYINDQRRRGGGGVAVEDARWRAGD